jgi:O-antigen/teichoic acid export membrane protein
MIDNLKSVSKDSAFYSVSNLMNKIVGFILLPLYSTYFSIQEYGLLALFDTIIDFTIMFSAIGIVSAFKRWYWEDHDIERQKNVFSTFFLFSVSSALFFSGIVYIVLSNYSQSIFSFQLSGNMINIYLLSLIANVVMQRIFILLQIQKLAKVNMIYNIIRATTTCLSTVILIIYFKMGIESVFLARIIGAGITFILLISRLSRNLSFRIDFALLKEMLHFSYPLAISSSISLIFTLSDRWLLKSLGNLEDVGQYSLAFRITNLIKFLVINSFLQAYVYTFFQKMHDPAQYNFFKKIVTYFALAIMVIGLMLVAFSREIMLLLAKTQEYQVSYTIIPILLIALLFSGLRQILVLPFYKYKQTKFISMITVLAGALNIGLNIIMIPYWKSYGAAASTAIAHICVVLAYFYKGKKFEEFSYETGRFFKILISGVIYIVVLTYFNSFPFMIGILAKVLLLLSYPGLLYVTGFFAEKEISMLKMYLKRPFRKKSL